MEKRYAIVQDGVVVNVAIAETPIAANWIEAIGQVGPGWTYDGTTFAPPVEAA